VPGTGVPGIVTRSFGKFYDVALNDEPRTLLCTVKGAVKRERRRTDLVAVGDRVRVTDVGEGEGQIESIEPRTRSLKRLARLTTDTEQVILANPDQALFVFSARNPLPHRRMLDRFLVLAESEDLPAMIAVNKMDLEASEPADGAKPARVVFRDYDDVYPVHYVSVTTGEGLLDLFDALKGKITVVAGPSGVGKSSLLNTFHPLGDRTIGDVSSATGKGKHTTTATQLYRLADDPSTFVADTPGIRALALHGIDEVDLDRCFPEFRTFLGGCFYPDCTHLHEPGCLIREAVDEGTIPVERYQSYVALRRGEHE